MAKKCKTLLSLLMVVLVLFSSAYAEATGIDANYSSIGNNTIKIEGEYRPDENLLLFILEKKIADSVNDGKIKLEDIDNDLKFSGQTVTDSNGKFDFSFGLKDCNPNNAEYVAWLSAPDLTEKTEINFTFDPIDALGEISVKINTYNLNSLYMWNEDDKATAYVKGRNLADKDSELIVFCAYYSKNKLIDIKKQSYTMKSKSKFSYKKDMLDFNPESDKVIVFAWDSTTKPISKRYVIYDYAPKMSLEFNNENPGDGGGKIKLTSNYSLSGKIDICWADEYGALEDMLPIESFEEESGSWEKEFTLHDKIAIPQGALYINVYADGIEKLSEDIPNNKLFTEDTFGNKLYSFGQLSDLQGVYTMLPNAFAYFENYGCKFINVSGDIVGDNIETELTNFKNCIDTCSIPVYATTGNHDVDNTDADFYWQKYTGHPRTFEITRDNNDGNVDDVFLFLGMSNISLDNPFSDEELEWLEEKLEQYKDKRVFLNEHLYIQRTCGDIDYAYSGHIRENENAQGTRFRNLLKHYKNVILFTGHSHFIYSLQSINKDLNIYDGQGEYCTMIHVGSLSAPRTFVDYDVSKKLKYDSSRAEGMVVDVYENNVVIKCVDLKQNKTISEAVYLVNK